MEQQLIDALNKAEKAEDIDEVSMMMIMARVASALSEVRDVIADCLTKVKQIYSEKEMELKLGGFTLVLNATDSIVDAKISEPVQMYILGSGSRVQKNLQQIMECIHG